ncbi:MAG: hypothetical protein K2X34_03040 [Hyphomonadaceae bacterium]|nr:hypothetical protein [Hyphomonadaceae bacterium]
MKKFLLAAALVSLAACASAPTPGGPRVDWACDGGAAYSVRVTSTGAAEVFAGGQVYTLPSTGAGRYSNGAVAYSDDGALGGAQGGPYTNCRRG